MSGTGITQNIDLIRKKVTVRCHKNGINPDTVTIVGVSKTQPPELASMAVKAGLRDLGENRVQEAASKIPLVRPIPTWHLVGHLQKNKVKRAVELFDIIQSVDSLEIAQELSQQSVKAGKELVVYLQVNSSHEPQKSGFDPAELLRIAEDLIRLPNLKISGLMTIGPLTDDIGKIERSFALTRSQFEKMREVMGTQFSNLSMGMSGDFELALDYGANVIRIGTAIFGPRILDK